jgi:hypothetical protein
MKQIIAYLRFIKDTWDFIAGSAPIDVKTVQALQKKCPRYSRNDWQEIANLIDRAVIFEHCDESWRKELKQRLTRIPFAIPSLHTLFDDSKVLGDCSRSLSNLFDRKQHETFNSALKRSYYGNEDCFQARVAEVWVMALRFYSKTQPHARRSEAELLEKPRPSGPDEAILNYMATSAQNLGFKSTKLTKLTRSNQAGESLHSSLSLATATPSLIQQNNVRYPSGYPDVESFSSDQHYLSWDKFELDSGQGAYISTFGLLRGFCFAFFRPTTMSFPISQPIIIGNPITILPTDLTPKHRITGDIASVDMEQHNISLCSSEATVRQNDKRKREVEGLVCVYFKEHTHYEWRVLRQVENADEHKVKEAATELFQTYHLIGVFYNHSLHTTELTLIATSDCWERAKDSSISTVLVSKRKEKLDLGFLADRAAYLYSG